MEYIDFYIYYNANSGNQIVKIKVPEQCCGIKTELGLRFQLGVSYFIGTKCGVHVSGDGTYKWIWDQWKATWEADSAKSENNAPKYSVALTNGCSCMSCNMFNEYAVPNQDGGKYKCFECRNII